MLRRVIVRSFAAFEPVQLNYETLVSGDELYQQLEESFGPKGAGLIAINNVPRYTEIRINLLKLARELTLLPEPIKESLVLPEESYDYGLAYSRYSVENDNTKTSFHANIDATEEKEREFFGNKNIWPIQQIPNLRPLFIELGREMIKVADILGGHIDRYLKYKNEEYEKDLFQDTIGSESLNIGRLINYIPTSEDNAIWYEIHKDKTVLTALTCPLYLDQDTGEIVSQDEKGIQGNIGLFSFSDSFNGLKINLSSDSMIFMLGEIGEDFSGGILKAQNHCVHSDKLQRPISRNTFAVYIKPLMGYKQNKGKNSGDFWYL